MKQLTVLINVDMGGPAVSDPEQHLLEHCEVHGGLASGVMDPLLGYLTVHLLLSVQWQEHFVNTFQKLYK